MATRSALAGALTTVLALAGAAATAGEAHAFELASTSRGEPVHWRYDRVEFAVDSAIDTVVAGGADAIANVFNAWTGQSGAPALRATVQPLVSGKPGYDRKNIILHAKDFAPAGNALAVTVLTFDDATGEILDADIVFNGKHKFAIDLGSIERAEPLPNEGTSTGVAKYPFDFVHVGAHEIGHSLGLGDVRTDRDTLMYGYTRPGMLERRTPSNDDLTGLAKIYGGRTLVAPGGVEGGGCHQGAHRDLPWSAAAIALLALSVVALRTRSAARCTPFAAAVAFCLWPSTALSTPSNDPVGDARVRIVESTTEDVDGVFRTELRVETTQCRKGGCPDSGRITVWGGRMGNIVQRVGPHTLPQTGESMEATMNANGAYEKVLIDSAHGAL